MAFIGHDFGETRAERRERSWFLTPVRSLNRGFLSATNAEPGLPAGKQSGWIRTPACQFLVRTVLPFALMSEVAQTPTLA